MRRHEGLQRKSLILIPCCKEKKVCPSPHHGGFEWNDERLVRSRRRLVELLRNSSDLSRIRSNREGILSSDPDLTVASDLYQGRFYISCGNALRALHDNIHVLIVSALNGLVHPSEMIANYELRMGDNLVNRTRVWRFWMNENLWISLLEYVNRYEIKSVWSLLPDSAPMFRYNSVFRDFWKNTQCPAKLVKVYNSQGRPAGSGSGGKRGLWLREVSENPILLEEPLMKETFSSIPGFTFEYIALK